MYLLAKEYDSFDTLPVHSRVRILRRELDALASNNIEFKRNNPGTPGIYDWFPKYVIKPRPFVPTLNTQADIWQDIPSCMRRGDGDCKDFAAWRLADLYCEGYRGVGFYIKVQQVGDLIVYHIQIEGYNPDGTFAREDPSKLLGMPVITTPEQLRAIMSGT